MERIVRRRALIIRLAVAAIVLVVAGCSRAPSLASSSPDGSIGPSPVATVAQTPPPGPSAAPSSSAGAPGPDLAWAPLPGLDLRGAYVAAGAAGRGSAALIGADTKTGALASWTSTDGAHWDRHWLDGSTFGGGTPRAVVAGGPGFVAQGWSIGTDLRLVPAIWTSADGIGWSLDPDPTGRFDGQSEPESLVATASSIVIEAGRPTGPGSALWSSSDGMRWLESTPPGALGAVIHLAAADDGYLAIANVDRGLGDGTTSPLAWRSADGRTWGPDQALTRHLTELSGVNDVLTEGARFVVGDDIDGFHVVNDDGSLTRIDQPTPYGTPTGGPAGLAWIGPPDDGGCLAAWIGPSDWHRVGLPSGGCPGVPDRDQRIALADGWLVVTAGATAADARVWAIRPTGSVPSAGAPEGMPAPPASAIPPVPSGMLTSTAPCPGSTPSISEIVRLSPYDRAACFGSRDLTFRAWVVDPGEGYGGTCAPLTPRWLHPCVLPDWWLAQAKGSNEVLDGLKRPDATGDLKGVGRWVSVTGHFDDPAATTCQLAAGPDRIGAPPTGWYVLRCREEFAVTRIVTTR